MTEEAVEATEAQKKAYLDLYSDDVEFIHDNGCVVTYSYKDGIHVEDISDPHQLPRDEDTTFFDKVHDDSWHRR